MATCRLGSFLCALGLSAIAAFGAPPGASADAVPHDGSHDFDFEFGSWQAHIRRLVDPLTGSGAWTQYAGSSTVRPVWGGRANLGELKVTGPAGSIEGLSLRLYDPASRQWRISWSNARDGALTTPLVGGFAHGVGEFYDREMFKGRAILVRFIFSGMSDHNFRIEQAFSEDGARHWETNWIADFVR